MLTARDALCPWVARVTADQHPSSTASEAAVYAVFAPEDEPARAGGGFLGVVTRNQIAPYPERIFADLLARRVPVPAEAGTPVDDLIVRLDRENIEAIAVEERGVFLGAVTRASLLSALLRGELTERQAAPAEGLHDATLRLLGLLTTHELETELLQQSIETLTALLKTRYGAIGIVDDQGGLIHFVHTGIPPEQAARIGKLPQGRGLLGAVIHENHALRLDDMSKDPRSAGFPAHHPPMKSLLAVPISHAGRVYGRLYFSDKHDATPFNAVDESLAARSADAMALTLAHHRLQGERRQAEQALHDIAGLLAAGSATETLSHKLVLKLADILGVDYAFIGEVSPHDARIIETIAFCDHGKIVDNIEYQLAPATVCGSVEGKTTCYFPEGARRLYPEDEILKEFRVEAFIGHPLLGSDGQVLGLLAVMHSRPLTNVEQIQSILQISASRLAAELERRHDEETLRRSEQNLRALAENANDGILVNSGGRHVFANRRLAELLGYSLEELHATDIEHLVHPDEYPKVAARFRARMAGENVPAQYETVLVAKNGAAIPVELNAAKTVWQGQPAGLVFVRDIRERLQATHALAEQRRTLETLLSNLTGMVYRCRNDPDWTLEFASDGALALTGHAPREFLDHKLAYGDLIHPDDRDKVWNDVQAAVAERRPFQLLYRIHAADGREKWVWEQGRGIFSPGGELVALEGYIADISAQHQAEEQANTLASAIEQTADSVIITDREGVIEYVNPAFERTTGYTRAEALGKKPNLVKSGMHDQGFYQLLWQTIRAGQPFREVFINRAKHGALYYEEKTITPLKDERGTITHFVSTGKDITARMQSEQETRRMQHFLDSVVENLPNMLFVKDAKDLTFVRFNKAAEELLGYARSEMLGKSDRDFFPKEEADFFTTMDREVLQTGELMDIPREPVHTLRRGTRLLHTQKIPILDERGRPLYLLGISEDITERVQAEDTAQRLGRILDNSTNEIYVFCADSLRFQQVNQGAQKNLGYSLAELRALTPLDIKPDFSREGFEQLIAPLKSGAQEAISFITNHRRKDGSLYPVEIGLQLSRNETPPVFVAIVQDITERKHAEERLSYLAYYDTLTGLPNRQLLRDRLRQTMFEADRSGRVAAVMLLDLDRFKFINDTLGHEAGDTLLKGVAERLTACVRHGDTVARLGGDEFTVVLANVARVDDVAFVTQKILGSFVQPFTIAGRELFVSPSIGITLYPHDDRDIDNLLKNADAAMYHAKESGRNTFQFFTAELNARAAERLELETALRHALERHEFLLHYQPLMDLKTGRLKGVEALLRWRHPQRGLVPPLDFIPLAEETGLIVPIGEWVLRTACAQAKAWHDAGFCGLHMAVNISGRQFQQQNLAVLVGAVLAETGLEPQCFNLELTESVLMRNVDAAIAVMGVLDAAGVGFSIDDFGTGYSSLSYLKRFPIDVLKIDRSFVRDITTDPDDAAIVTAIMALARTLDIEVVAEGVETEEQLAFLRARGCDVMQGYYFSKPVDAAALTALLKKTTKQGKGKPRAGKHAKAGSGAR
ncbi:MAG: PAS domain S-box protein [Gammaproteobacteria bacterium]|nr:PAS domain S-box protein [Gammaproteobacteria bacterium]